MKQRAIKLHETVNVGRVETLEDVLRLLESLDDLGERLEPIRGRIRALRTCEKQPKAEEPKNGRRMIG